MYVEYTEQAVISSKITMVINICRVFCWCCDDDVRSFLTYVGMASSCAVGELHGDDRSGKVQQTPSAIREKSSPLKRQGVHRDALHSSLSFFVSLFLYDFTRNVCCRIGGDREPKAH